MNKEDKQHDYPTPEEIDAWLNSIWELVDATACPAHTMEEQGFSHNLGIRHSNGFRYVRFAPERMAPFFAYWQPTLSQPAPLLVHVPGYGAEMNTHPEIVASGYNVLEISPLGYSTPSGADTAKKRDGDWPVLPDTILSNGQRGYREWLSNCAMAVNWAMGLPETIPNRVSFFGTSQGGGGSLLLTSLYKGKGVRCVAADLPFLTDFRTAAGRGAYRLAASALQKMDDMKAAWRAVGLMDTLSHVHRLDLPVLLTAGGDDEVCPPETIEHLFEMLPGTRSYTRLEKAGHRYTKEFVPLATAWFRLYA
jgi:cephalosporin-C deacetylase-like acetyl esterase